MAVAATLGLALAGCGGSDEPEPKAEVAANVVQAGAPGEPSRKLSADALDDVRTPRHTETDVAFVKGMIHHHGQAILMARWVPRRTASRDIRLMAARMKATQEGEIELMQRWLEDRGVEPPQANDHQGHDHGSGERLPPGMLTSKQLGRLYAADGGRFDRLFLRFMTHHHRGALDMVRRLYADGGGLEPEVDKLAREIATDQEIEIGRMADLLAGMR